MTPSQDMEEEDPLELTDREDGLLPKHIWAVWVVLATRNSFSEAIYGSLACLASASFSGLGNSLEPNSVMVFAHLFLLVLGWEVLGIDVVAKRKGGKLVLWLILSIALVIVQACGSCIGFKSIFGFPAQTNLSVLQAWGFGVGIWVIFLGLCLVPHLAVQLLLPDLPLGLASIVFPITYTFTSHYVLGEASVSTFASISNAVLDFAPLRQLASVGGSPLICYVVTQSTTTLAMLVASTARLSSPDVSGDADVKAVRSERTKKLQTFANVQALVVAVLLSIGGFGIRQDAFYQRDISTQILPTVNVSCVLAQGLGSKDTELREAVWSNTAARVANGDAFVLWSEEAFILHSKSEEDEVLSRARLLLATAKHPLRNTYLGLCYLRKADDGTKNMFVLLDPTGHIAWSYAKAHPVPLIEADVSPGPEVLPVYDSKYGRLGGAICFDMDYSSFMYQAGKSKVDLILHPSWTWSDIGSRHFDGNALRAIENGASIFRCSSDGESGVVSPLGKVHARQLTGHDPRIVVVFSLPIQKGVETAFINGGFALNGLLAALTCTIYAIIFFSLGWCRVVTTFQSRRGSYRYRAFENEHSEEEPQDHDHESVVEGGLMGLELKASTNRDLGPTTQGRRL